MDSAMRGRVAALLGLWLLTWLAVGRAGAVGAQGPPTFTYFEGAGWKSVPVDVLLAQEERDAREGHQPWRWDPGFSAAVDLTFALPVAPEGETPQHKMAAIHGRPVTVLETSRWRAEFAVTMTGPDARLVDLFVDGVHVATAELVRPFGLRWYTVGVQGVSAHVRQLLPERTRTGEFMVELRGSLVPFGFAFGWNAQSKTAFARKQGVMVIVGVGSSRAVVNGEQVALPAPVEIRGGRVQVPESLIARIARLYAGSGQGSAERFSFYHQGRFVQQPLAQMEASEAWAKQGHMPWRTEPAVTASVMAADLIPEVAPSEKGGLVFEESTVNGWLAEHFRTPSWRATFQVAQQEGDQALVEFRVNDQVAAMIHLERPLGYWWYITRIVMPDGTVMESSAQQPE